MVRPDPDGADDPVHDAAERLVAELRDECRALGVTARAAPPAGLEASVRAFAHEARRLGASPERMLILLKSCLRDERLASRDRAAFELAHDAAVRMAIEAYFEDVSPAG
jgi:hypothetical protein